MADEFCLKMPDFHVTFRDLLYASKSTTWGKRLYFPSEGRRAEDFFNVKNPTASAGFEPPNLGTKGQHATSRAPKPLFETRSDCFYKLSLHYENQQGNIIFERNVICFV